MAAWLASFLGVRGARLVRMAKEHRRTVSPNYARAGAATSFSDGFPILLANDASLAELCRRLVASGKAPVRWTLRAALCVHRVPIALEAAKTRGVVERGGRRPIPQPRNLTAPQPHKNLTTLSSLPPPLSTPLHCSPLLSTALHPTPLRSP